MVQWAAAENWGWKHCSIDHTAPSAIKYSDYDIPPGYFQNSHLHMCLDTWCSLAQYWPWMRHQQNRGFTLGDWMVPALIGKMAAKSTWRKIQVHGWWQNERKLCLWQKVQIDVWKKFTRMSHQGGCLRPSKHWECIERGTSGQEMAHFGFLLRSLKKSNDCISCSNWTISFSKMQFSEREVCEIMRWTPPLDGI